MTPPDDDDRSQLPSPWRVSPPPGTTEPPASEAQAADAPSEPATAAPSVEAPPPIDEPLLPAVYSERDLREAVGAKPPQPESRRARARAKSEADDADDAESDDKPRRPRSRKGTVVAALSLVAGLGIAALVFLGRANSDRYFIACESERVVAERGRSFPPWGAHALDSPEWKPIKIPPEAECQALETEDTQALADAYSKILVDQASNLLTAREVTKVDDAEAQLRQALLLARDPNRKDQRKAIERLLGDVGYWRASAKVREASTALGEAAKQFDAAVEQVPRYAKDASAWATYARKIADELHAGPSGVAPSVALPTAPQTPEHPTAPTGTALPVEPTRGSADSAAQPAAPVDAGLPTGGVLL